MPIFTHRTRYPHISTLDTFTIPQSALYCISYKITNIIMQTYTLEAVEKVLAQAVENDGVITTIPGTLLDSYIISIPGKRHIVALETYLSAWSSTYRVRQYKTLPKKYQHN